MTPQPAGNVISLMKDNGPQVFVIVDVHRKGDLMADALRLTIRQDRSIIDAAHELKKLFARLTEVLTKCAE